MEDLRARAARVRAAGGYGTAVGAGPVGIEAHGRPSVRFRPELGYSSKPVVGRPITGAKRVALRALFHVFDDLARQTDAAVAGLWGRADALERRGAEWEARLDEGLAGETRERERAQRDIAALSQRLDALERTLADVDASSRLSRLERTARSATGPATAAAAPASGAPAPPGASAAPAVEPMLGMDYERFEGRYRPEAAVRAHQRRYVEILSGRRRVVDVGCGRGELVDMLRQDGVDAYGIELEGDFVALAADRGVPVLHGDGIAHVAGLAPESVDGVVASHVVEHLEPQDVLRLVHGAHEALAEGGVLILETPNPESLLAGSVNFHRDITHRRPIHPDTLAFLCESAGFREVEVLRLSPFQEGEVLPPPPGDGPEAAHLAAVVDRLNAIVFGFQDYAVVARR